MTNLALALREAPDIAGLVRQVVIMGGAFGINGVLGNVTPGGRGQYLGRSRSPPTRVTGATWPLVMVGLDVTQKTRMPTPFLRALANEAGEAGRFIWEISRFYEAFHLEGGVDSIYVHDSSAVAYLLNPTSSRPGGRHPGRQRGPGIGLTIQKPDGCAFPPGDWDNRPSHKICNEVDAERFKALYRQTILRGA